MKTLIVVLLFSAWQLSWSQNFTTEAGQVKFTSNAPLEDINAASSKLRGVINAADQRFAFSVDVVSFEGFNSALQREHFAENYLEAAKFPEATFSGKIIESVDFTKPQSMNVRAKGILEIHGVKVERIIPVKIAISASLVVTITTSFNVAVADHDIAIPKIVNQKIAENIAITVSAELRKQ